MAESCETRVNIARFEDGPMEIRAKRLYGFSLLELLAVITILGIVVAIAPPLEYNPIPAHPGSARSLGFKPVADRLRFRGPKGYVLPRPAHPSA